MKINLKIFHANIFMLIMVEKQVLLKKPDHTPGKAKFPVIDAHNHLFGDVSGESLLEIMDAAGVKIFLNVTGNVSLPFDEKGYTIRRRGLSEYIENYVRKFPGRFAAFTMSDFARWDDFTIFKTEDFVDELINRFEEDVKNGAKGLKVTKELGLRFTDTTGRMVPVDDKRLYPIWKRAGEMGLPVLIHVSDPVGFFLKNDERNEHYDTLKEFPGWSFYGSTFSKMELLEQRNRMIADHPGTTFILPHVANYPEDLAYVSEHLDDNSNVYIDFSARIDELGRQPYSARDFFIRYQDRILFGVDMPLSVEVYRAYFRFLETKDEYFDYPDYLGRWGNCRWKIYGLYLPDEVLKKIYYGNALKIIPALSA
ncbi:MAG: amidohydrolase family protein [Spirochaetota bacterium]